MPDHQGVRHCRIASITALGIAYVEPIARAQAGQLPVEEVWAGMVQGMPQGEPRPGDKGLERTHTWGRTYFGRRHVLPGRRCPGPESNGKLDGLQPADRQLASKEHHEFLRDLSIRIAIVTVHQIASRLQPHRAYENETDFVRRSFILAVTNCTGNRSLLSRCVITPAHVFAKGHQCK
jgi:hypothetical protein